MSCFLCSWDSQVEKPKGFFFFWPRWVFIAARRLSPVGESGGHSLLRCTGFSLRWPLPLRSIGSRCTGFSSCGSQALEHRLSSFGAQAQLLRGMWDPPGPGPEPVSPALAGGLPTTAPPGKPPKGCFKEKYGASEEAWVNDTNVEVNS